MFEIGDPLWLGREGLFGKLVLQKTGVADESRVEGRSGDIKTGIPIEKSKAANISAKKSPEGTEGGFGRKPTSSFL